MAVGLEGGMSAGRGVDVARLVHRGGRGGGFGTKEEGGGRKVLRRLVPVSSEILLTRRLLRSFSILRLLLVAAPDRASALAPLAPLALLAEPDFAVASTDRDRVRRRSSATFALAATTSRGVVVRIFFGIGLGGLARAVRRVARLAASRGLLDRFCESVESATTWVDHDERDAPAACCSSPCSSGISSVAILDRLALPRA